MKIFDTLKNRKSRMDAALAEAEGTPRRGSSPSFKNVVGKITSTELPATYAESQALKRRLKK